jgi:chorismate mutase
MNTILQKFKKVTEDESQHRRPIMIAGPCSAESESQVLETAIALKKMNIDLFRAGIWKPRTRPGLFEGVGSIGLEWLRTVKQETNLPVATEVANVKHVYEALKSGIDVFWIGARTSANPFAVQEIADSLKGVDITILVKNPVNPDVSLWLGVIERIEKVVKNNVCAIHRGVTQFTPSIYRNKPEWGLFLELKKLRPDLIFIADPSHIAGNRELIQNISQTAIDLMFDGLMIEAHICPEIALSDKQQQITPLHLEQLVKSLIIRKETPDGLQLETIEDLRKKISYIDEQIIDLLSFRMDVVHDIAIFKKQNQMTIFQEGRWNNLIEQHREKAEQKNINLDFVISIFNLIHQESINKQTKIINELG